MSDGRDLLAERQRRQQHQLGAGVVAVDIGAGVGFGIAQRLRLFQHRRQRHAALFHLGEDVVAGAVEDAVERRDVVARDAFAQHRVDRDAAADAGFHGQVDAGADGAVPDLRPAGGHQFLVGGDHRFAVLNGGFDNLAKPRPCRPPVRRRSAHRDG